MGGEKLNGRLVLQRFVALFLLFFATHSLAEEVKVSNVSLRTQLVPVRPLVTLRVSSDSNREAIEFESRSSKLKTALGEGETNDGGKIRTAIVCTLIAGGVIYGVYSIRI